MRINLVDIGDRPRYHGGKSFFEKDGIIVLLTITEEMMTLNTRKPSKFELNTCEVIGITRDDIWKPHIYSKDTMYENDYIQLISEFEDKISVNMKLTSMSEMRKHTKEHDAHFLYPGEKASLKTFNNTPQLGRMNLCIPMRQNVKYRNPILQRHCINDRYAIDTWFYTNTSYEGYNCAHIFYGTMSKVISHYGLETESYGPNALLDFSCRKVSHYQ